MMMTKYTQHQKILGHMIAQKDQQEWFFPYDFMPPRMTLDYVYCVGYEATARFAELGKRYPDMLETLPAGKYKKRRIRFESMDKWLYALPKDLRYMFHRAGLTKSIERPGKRHDLIIYDEATTMTDEQIQRVGEIAKQGKLFDMPEKPTRRLMI